MKKYITKLILAAVLLLSSSFLFAQSPESFNYQAAVRDNGGNIQANQAVAFRFTILQTTASGTAVYQETHSATTSDLGLVSLEIGTGTVVSGNFSTIDWGADSYFLQVELDDAGGTNFSNMGTSQLRSVPYALHANSVTNDQVDDADADPSNELQTLSLSGDTLSISNGNSVLLPPGTVDTDDQTLSLSNDSLFIQDGNAVDLSGYLDNTDAQTLSLSGYDLSISNGNTVTLTDSVNDADADPSNEIQTLVRSGSTVSLSNGGGSFVDQVDDADNDATNEIQTLSRSGSTVSLSNGGGSFTDQVDDADNDASNEIQTLSRSGSTISLSNGGGSFTDEVDDADNSTTNELQTLSISGSNLTLSNGGGTVAIPSTGDNLGNHTATTNIRLNGNYLSGDGGSEGITVDNTGEVGIRTLNPAATFHLTQDGTGISDGMRYTSSAANGQDWYFYMGTGDDLIIRDDASDVMCFDNGTDRVGINTNAPTANLSVSGTANKTGGGSWATFSDRRVKRDVQPYADGLAEVMKIRPVTFKFKGDFAIEEDPDREFVGVIAQEIQEVAPYMVETVVYEPKTSAAVSEEGNPDAVGKVQANGGEIAAGTELLQYDPSALNYMLINAVQEQQQQIDAQKAENEALRRELAELRRMIEEMK